MSYDIHLEIQVDDGRGEPFTAVPADIGNYTSNVSHMWGTALGYRLADLDGRTARDAVDDLLRAVASMEDQPGTFLAMNPANGWGDYEGALDYLRRLRDACRAYPNATIRISH